MVDEKRKEWLEYYVNMDLGLRPEYFNYTSFLVPPDYSNIVNRRIMKDLAEQLQKDIEKTWLGDAMKSRDKRKTWLETAKEITESDGDRRRDYGRPLANFLLIAIYYTVHFSGRLRFNEVVTPLDVAKLNGALLKTARDHHRFKDDNFIDTIGYANCVDDMNQHMIELGFNGVEDFRYFNLQDMQNLYLWVVDREGTTKTDLGYEESDELENYLAELQEKIDGAKHGDG